MEPYRGIGQLGFRRWYQRQLLEAHAWLVSGLLALILAASLVEVQANVEAPVMRATMLGGAVLSLVGFALAWWRYRCDLLLAEHFDDAAHCPNCRSYGNFQVLDGPESASMRVCCRRCGREWPILPPA